MKNNITRVSGIAIAAAALLGAAGCVLDADPLKLPYSGYAPRERNDGWTISDPASEGMDASLVEQAYRLFHSDDIEDFPTAISLLVAKNGKLVAESWCHDPDDIDVKQCVWSVTKSFTSLVFGIAQDEGYTSDNLDEAPASFGTRGITTRQALTMRSGIDYENSGEDGDDSAIFQGAPDSLRSLIFSLPLKTTPGSTFYYKNSDPQLVSFLIEDATGMSMADYAETKLFSPLGITDYRWDSYKDGTTYGGFGIWLKSRDMLKVGEMVRQGGVWNGTRVVPASWIATSTTEQTRTDNGRQYGYYWWVRPEFGGYSAWGHGGQYIYVIPDLDMTIVFTAEADAVDVGTDEIDEFERLVELLYEAAGGA